MLRVAIISLLALAGCADQQVNRAPQAPAYDGVVTRLLDGDLVNFMVAVRGAETPAVVEQYARCAAAQYTLIRGYSFARQVRTTVDQQGGIWTADAVYTISADLPRGFRTIDAEVVVADCATSGIPTV